MAHLAPFIELPYQSQDGQSLRGIVVNPIKDRVRGFHVVPTPDPSVTLAAAGAAGSTAELKFLIDSQGHFDWTHIIGTQTSSYFLEFFDQGTQHKLQNRPVQSDNIVGTAQRPFRLPEPYFMNVGDGMRVILATVRNLLSQSPITVKLALYGRRFYHHQAQPEVAVYMNRVLGKGERTHSYFMSPNEFGGDGTPVTVAGSGTTTFTFQSDADFDTDIHKIMFSSQADFTFRLREAATNRILSNGAILSRLGMGSAQFPFLLADTLFIERSKTLTMDITNLSASTNRIAVTLAGRVLKY